MFLVILIISISIKFGIMLYMCTRPAGVGFYVLKCSITKLLSKSFRNVTKTGILAMCQWLPNTGHESVMFGIVGSLVLHCVDPMTSLCSEGKIESHNDKYADCSFDKTLNILRKGDVQCVPWFNMPFQPIFNSIYLTFNYKDKSDIGHFFLERTHVLWKEHKLHVLLLSGADGLSNTTTRYSELHTHNSSIVMPGRQCHATISAFEILYESLRRKKIHTVFEVIILSRY